MRIGLKSRKKNATESFYAETYFQFRIWFVYPFYTLQFFFFALFFFVLFKMYFFVFFVMRVREQQSYTYKQ